MTWAVSIIKGSLQKIYLLKKDDFWDHDHRRVNAYLIEEELEIMLMN